MKPAKVIAALTTRNGSFTAARLTQNSRSDRARHDPGTALAAIPAGESEKRALPFAARVGAVMSLPWNSGIASAAAAASATAATHGGQERFQPT